MQTQIKSRPILFSGAMVRAILEGRKFQTRRAVKRIDRDYGGIRFDGKDLQVLSSRSGGNDLDSLQAVNIKCPYGKAGDHLWVRETWCEGFSDSHECWGYRADMKYQCGTAIPDDGKFKTWKPSIFMPRSHSRILLEVTGIRAERVNDISEEDAIAEGIYNHLPSAVEGFKDLWDSINSEKYPWISNPFVWVVAFKKVEPCA